MMQSSTSAAGGRSVEIRQIFYSNETRQQLDPGFIPLDNTGQRPDWYEYWPIRQFLLAHERTLDENTLYGFFSPKFARKTTLDSATVKGFAANVPAGVDVVAFSPFFDQGAIHLNTFEQAATNHPGIWPVFEQAMAVLAAGFDPHAVPMDSRRTIFCNYFAATPAFWRAWLAKCEVLFSIAENGTSALGTLLNTPVAYAQGAVPAKIFVIERMVSIVLALDARWRVKHFDPLRLPMSGSVVSPYPADLLVLDALKTAAIETGHPHYLQMFTQIRETLLANARNAAAQKRA